MVPCSRDEAIERVDASAVTLALLDIEPEDLHQLLLGKGNLSGLAAHERAIAGAHRRMLAWVIDEGYADVVDGEIEGIASALGLDGGVCDWEQFFAVFPDAWFLEDDAGEATTGRPADPVDTAGIGPRRQLAEHRRSTRLQMVGHLNGRSTG